MLYRSLLLSLFLVVAAPCQEAPAQPTVTPQNTPTPSPTVPHRKPARPGAITKAQPAQASPTPAAKVNDRSAGLLVGFVVWTALYFLPWIVAASRHHRNRTAIAVANFFLGWTIVGWIATLIWASTANVEPKSEAVTE